MGKRYVYEGAPVPAVEVCCGATLDQVEPDLSVASGRNVLQRGHLLARRPHVHGHAPLQEHVQYPEAAIGAHRAYGQSARGR